MSQHFMTVCVFCLLCATHAPCSAHTEFWNDDHQTERFNNGLFDPNRLDHVASPISEEISNHIDHNINDNSLETKAIPITYSNKKLKVKMNPSVLHKKQHYIDNMNGNNLQKIETEPKDAVVQTNNLQSHQNSLLLNFNKENYLSNNDQSTSKMNSLRQLNRHKRVKKAVSDVHNVKSNNKDNSVSNTKMRDFLVNLDEHFYIKKLFHILDEKNDDKIDMEAFRRLVGRLGLDLFLANTTNINHQKNLPSQETCIPGENILSIITNHDSSVSMEGSANSSHNILISVPQFQQLCPLLIYQLAADSSIERNGCVKLNAISSNIVLSNVSSPQNAMWRDSHNESATSPTVTVWMYASLSVIVISACGLFGVAVIPFMQKHFYHQLLQFLVALAVGTLCGDALLHLLPHAMMPHVHVHSLEELAKQHDQMHSMNMWKGFVAMTGVIFFYFVEKCLTLGAEWRKRRQKKQKLPSRVRVMRDNDSIGNNSVGEKLCKHKYSSYPYCYDEIATETLDDHHNRSGAQKSFSNSIGNSSKDPSQNKTNSTILKDLDNLSTSRILNNIEASQNNLPVIDSNQSNLKNKTDVDLPRNDLQMEESYTVILREHESKHHGHSHTHGHVHSAPKSLSSVAWMVIMGDGLHNFTDGMAIGAAFASGLAGGFSTSVAVFCHELPHEIGDFAVLLKAGMTAKQAVFYNILSSVLCFMGCILGVIVGRNETASEWIFAAAAGMFIYIALVDMIPELTSSHSNEGGSLLQCVLQFLGLMTGLGIMTLIAFYEHDLKAMFQNE